METIHVDRDCTASNWNEAMEDIITNVIAPKLGSYSNLTYIGMSVYGDVRDAIFQIGDNTNYYFALKRNGGSYSSSLSPYIYGTYSLTANNTPIGYNYRSDANRFSWKNNNYGHVSFYMYSLTDEDDNLKAFWIPAPAYDYRNYSNPIVFAKTAKNRDVILQFRDGNRSTTCFFLDDPTHYPYYINHNTYKYVSDTDVFKIKYLPIVDQDGGNKLVDAIEDKFVFILNSNISAYVNGDYGYTNDSGYIRKLIKVNGVYYRQLVTNWWYEDPKGDEAVELIDT